VLLIEAELRESEIHGIGLFCSVPILKGAKVWEFNPMFDLVINEADLSSLPSSMHSFLQKYAYRSVETLELIVNVDLSRHMNHSDTPSLVTDSESNYYAADDLPPGTELTCDYRVFSLAGCSDFLGDGPRF
jgi:uncharacterized protein